MLHLIQEFQYRAHEGGREKEHHSELTSLEDACTLLLLTAQWQDGDMIQLKYKGS
jgi:hypothetical protein